MKVVLAIPAYNCAPQLERVLASLDKDLVNIFSDILVIDNISPDNTLAVAQSYKGKIKNFHVFRNKNNYSLGGTHKVAFLYGEKVGATHVAILHGDDQAVAAELRGLVQEASGHSDAAAILGSRFMKGSKLEGYDWKRIAGNRCLNVIYTFLTGRVCHDLGSGINVFQLAALSDHTYLEFADRLTFNFEILLYLIGQKARLIYYPITWRESDQVSNARNLNIAKIAFMNVIKWRLGRLTYMHDKKPQDYESEEV